MATSWQGLFEVDADGNYVTTVKRNGALSGGTAGTLPHPDNNAINYLPAAFERGRRFIMNLLSTGTITSSMDIAINIAVGEDAGEDTFTTTVKYGTPTISGGTTVTLPLNEDGAADATFFSAAFMRFQRAVLNDRSSGN